MARLGTPDEQIIRKAVGVGRVMVAALLLDLDPYRLDQLVHAPRSKRITRKDQ